MSATKKRKIWAGNIVCTKCKHPNQVKVEKEITTPSSPAEFEIIVTVDGAQTTLEEAED